MEECCKKFSKKMFSKFKKVNNVNKNYVNNCKIHFRKLAS